MKTPLPDRFASSAIGLTLLLAGAASLHAGAAAPVETTPTGPVMLLPPFLVSEAARPIPWRYAQIPGFEIISQAGDATTREFMEGHLRALDQLSLILPREFQGPMSTPRLVILTNQEQVSQMSLQLLGRGNAAAAAARGATPAGRGSAGPGGIARSASSGQTPLLMRGSVRSSGTSALNEAVANLNTPGGLAPSSARGSIRGSTLPGGRAGTARAGQPPAGRAGNVRFHSNLRLDDSDFTATYAMLNDRSFDQALVRLTPATVQQLIEMRFPRLPSWYASGVLATFARSTAIGDDGVSVGPLAWGSPEESQALANTADFPRTILLPEDFFAQEPPFATPEALALWQSQAALVVRWALDPRNGVPAAGFRQLVARVAEGTMTEAYFKECLGLDYTEARDRWSDYLPIAVKSGFELKPAEKANRPAPPRLRDATKAEVARLKGEWERLEVAYVQGAHPQYAARYAGQAEDTLRGALGAGEKSPEFLAVLALYEIGRGNDEGARPYLGAAVAAGVKRPRIYFEAARIRLGEVRRAAPPGGRLDATGIAQVLDTLRAAHRLSPPLPEVYLLAADLWAQSGTVPAAGDFEMLESAVRWFPGDLALLHRVAVVDAAYGRTAQASAHIERGLRLGREPEITAPFEKLKAALPQPGAK